MARNGVEALDVVDKLVHLYQQRIALAIAQGLPADWDGIERLAKSKPQNKKGPANACSARRPGQATTILGGIVNCTDRCSHRARGFAPGVFLYTQTLPYVIRQPL